MNYVHANLITLIFQHHQHTEKTLLCLLLGCCFLSPSVTERHFVCAKMGMASTGLQEESAGKMGVIMWKTTLLEKVSLLKGGKEKKKKRG